ncbi:MAG: hypothetical protein HS116_00795 [Planctomycetes bacterium]|nr:hypothetical protein [Planctomycetota bacterium]
MSAHRYGDHRAKTEALFAALPGPQDTVLLSRGELAAIGPDLLNEPEDSNYGDANTVFKALRRIQTLPRLRPARRLRREREEASRAMQAAEAMKPGRRVTEALRRAWSWLRA